MGGKMKKIAVVVDNHSWCWSTTAKNTAHGIKGYKFDFFTNDEFRQELGTGNDFSKYAMVWFRGYSSVAMNEKSVHELKTKFISTIGTGGKKLELRLEGAERTAKEGLGLIVQNQMAVHEAYKRGYGNVWCVPNGVNTRLFHPGKKKKGKVVGVAANTAGSRGDLKGVPFTKEACNILGFTYKEVNAELPLSHESMAEWYRTIDYYLQPSDTEGCSNSVMEAMASGLPVFICDNVGYHGEICRSAIDHADGQVIFVRRNAKDIAEKIMILENNPYIKQRCIDNALKFAQNHDWKYISPVYKDIFDQVLNMKPKKSKAVQKGFSVGKTYYVNCVKSVRTKQKGYIAGRRYILREEQYLPIKKNFEVIK
jgi:hypothetical protein